MKKLEQGIYLLLGAALIIWSFYSFLQKPAPAHYQDSPVIKVGEESILVEIADTDEERSQGLSGRESLERGRGLLFIFDVAGTYGFWMKDMNFPIDIVWMDSNWNVVSINREVAPETFPTTFHPSEPTQHVLEIASGEAARLGIDIGGKLFLDR